MLQVCIDGAKLEVLELDIMGEPRNGPAQQELQKITGVLAVPQVLPRTETCDGQSSCIVAGVCKLLILFYFILKEHSIKCHQGFQLL